MTFTDWTVLGLAVAGVLLTVIGVLHVWLPRALGWTRELENISAMSRLVVKVHAGYIGFTCVGFGLVALFLGRELVSGSPLAVAVSLFAAVFFFIRWLLEIGPVGALATVGPWRHLHRLGLVGWLAIAACFAAAAGIGLLAPPSLE